MRLFDLASIKQSRRLALAVVAVVGVLAMGLTFSSVLNFKSSGGSLSAYLIGAVNAKSHTDGDFGTAHIDVTSLSGLATSDTVEAVVRLVNPTNIPLTALVAAYDSGDTFLDCEQRSLGRNEYAQVNLIDEFSSTSDNHAFTVKVLTFDSLNRVQAGVKGWLSHYVAETSDGGDRRFLHMRETELQEVPVEVAKAGEAAKIKSDCGF